VNVRTESSLDQVVHSRGKKERGCCPLQVVVRHEQFVITCLIDTRVSSVVGSASLSS